jgi:uncharacterized protein (DUF169 family)
MSSINKYNTYGEELEYKLKLRTDPIAVKMLEEEADIPEEAFRPNRDKGIHLAQCQAFAMSRRDGMTVAMLKEDHWCFTPLVAYGLFDKPEDEDIQNFFLFQKFKKDKYIGLLSAPLKTSTFEPDLVMVYCEPAQLRTMLMPLHHFGEQPVVNSQFFPPSCAHAVVPVIDKKQYFVTLPDIGEDMRTIGSKEEIIISIPRDKLEEVVKGLHMPLFEGADFVESPMIKMGDFKQPPLYKRLFNRWGLYT